MTGQSTFGIVVYSVLVLLTLVGMFCVLIRQLSNDEPLDFMVTFAGWTLLATTAVMLVLYT